jgi:hypothetical protein
LELVEVMQVTYLPLTELEDQIQFLTQAVLRELLRLLLKVVVMMFNLMALVQMEDQVLDVMVGMIILAVQETHLLLVHLKEIMVEMLETKHLPLEEEGQVQQETLVALVMELVVTE